MRRIRHHLEWQWLAALIAVASWFSARGQARYQPDVEPQLFRMRVASASVGAYAEAHHEEVSYRGGYSSTFDRFFAGPLIGLNVEGSIYHPNLMQYTLASDWAVGWTEEKTTTSQGFTLNRSGFDYIGNFSANAILLANKPFRASLYASSSHSFREYDFFNRALVDTLRYGGTAGYSEGPVPFTISLTRYEEDADGFGYKTSLRQTTLNLEAHNDRETGGSTFNYTFNDYQRSVDTTGGSGIEQTVGLSDRETFGTKNVEMRNSVSYSKRELNGEPGDAAPNEAITAASHLQVQHRPNLMSTYDARYLRDEANAITSENSGASAGVQHKLYSSLTSGLRFEANRYTASRADTEFKSTQYIGAWSEAYTKKINQRTRLSVGGSLGFSHTDQESTAFVPVLGEAHTFTGGPLVDSFFLRLLNAEAGTVDVFSPDRTIRYIRDADYTVIVAGNRTIIQLVQPSPSGLTAASQVVVDYQATSQGTGTIDGRFSDAQVRLDLFDGMFGVYARFSEMENTASRGLVVENSTDVAFGADYTRQWFRTGAEYQIHESTFSSYTTARAYQSFTFRPDDASSLGVTFSEGTTDYDSANRVENFFSVIMRYHQGLTRYWAFDLDAGVNQRWGTDTDQLIAAVRPGISYNIGKFSMKASYDFEYRTSESGEERVKHLLAVRARRSF